jgi:hypothetical protein
LKNFEKFTNGINKDKLEDEVEENEIKEIEKKRKKYLDHKERARQIKIKYNLINCLGALMEKLGLF